MPRKAGHADLVSDIRGAAKRALRDLDHRGKPLSKIWADAFEERPLDALNTLAKFLPKEQLLEINDGQLLTDVLADMNKRNGVTLEHQPDPEPVNGKQAH